MAEYDILMAKYRDQPDALAAIAANRAGFTLLILKNEQKAKVLLEAVLRDFPDTKSAAMAKVALHSLSQEGKAEQVAKAAQARAKFDQLIGCEAPELDFIWSSQEGLGKLSSLRGRVVVLDFWATWCGPCIASFPKVRKEVERFASSPVVILGVTSLQGKVHGLGTKPIDVKEQPEKEYAFTAEFMKKHDMTWPVAFTAQDVFNPDYLVRGIPSIVIIDPAGKIRHAGLNPHTRGVDIEGKVTGILKEFNMPVPASL